MPLGTAIDAWVSQTLRKSGRLSDANNFSSTPLPGNPERKDHVTLHRHVITVNDQSVALLTLGTKLSGLRERSALFTQNFSDLACPVFAHDSIEGQDALLSEYFDGTSTQQALAEPAIGENGVLAALEKLAARFKTAQQPSTSDAARAELQQLFSRVIAIEQWTSFDRSFLTGVVFPFAEQKLLAAPHRQRVSNGDLTLGNLLIDASGKIKLIDYEQAALTHFFDEDWLRITYWNAPQSIRDFALAQISDLLATQLYLCLKQLAFEADVIHPAKARTDIRYWSGEIRNLLAQHSPAIAQSPFWPRSNPAVQEKTLRLYSTAIQNYHRAHELYDYAFPLTEAYNQSCVRIFQREDKIQRMQASFSWRCTAWLRALRRLLIKQQARPTPLPKLPLLSFPFAKAELTPPKTPSLLYHISTGLERLATAKETTLSGWVFSPENTGLCAVRARVDERVFPGKYGLDRQDVPEKFLPHANSGFSVDFAVEKTSRRLELEVGNEQGEWYIFFTATLQQSQTHIILDSQPTMDGVSVRYTHWVAQHDTLQADQIKNLRHIAKLLPRQPLISLVMPVYNTDERWLRRAIESVQAQVYSNWELCIADDASPLPHVDQVLKQFAAQDPRIKIVSRTSNGHISAASNSAIELTSGEFTAFIDHDDEIPPHALYYFAELINRHPNAELIYSDEDKITETGVRFHPHFKPGWNPDLLNCQNYLCHLTAYRTSTLKASGGFRTKLEGAQDWDLALRITEHIEPDRIHHIPRILYHWRAIEGSTALHLQEKDYATQAAKKTLEDHFQRTRQTVQLSVVKGRHWHARYIIPNPAPLVTLVIPTRNRRELLATCVESILAKTKYPNFEFLIADNESDDPALPAFYEKHKAHGRFTVISCPGPFNFSSINNRAVKQASGTIIGLLNNDLEAMTPDWLDEMVGHALRPEIGVVGAKLYYPDMLIQHAGIITGLGGVAGHAFKKYHRDDTGTPQFRPHLLQNLSAVTAACVVMRKSVFEQAGGFDEENLKIAFNDVDFCLRVRALGYRNLFTPFAELIHHESASRGAEDTPEKIVRFQREIEYMKQRWGRQLLEDPAYNPNLSLDTEDFAYAFPPRLGHSE